MAITDGKIYEKQALHMEIDVQQNVSTASVFKMIFWVDDGDEYEKAASLKAGSNSIIEADYAVGELQGTGIGHWRVKVDGRPSTVYRERIYPEKDDIS